jgi:hypothetical protein
MQSYVSVATNVLKLMQIYFYRGFLWDNRRLFLTVVVNSCHWSQQCVSGFSKAKSANGGSILSSNQFLKLPQQPQKIKLASKVVKVDSKIIILLPKI